MKQKIFVFGFFLLATGATFYFVSCKKEKVYSCNDALNDYAKVNLESYQTISRARLAEMGIDTQFAIFNSLSSNNKVRIFKEKIQALLDMDTIPEDDKIHLKKISDYITGKIYDTDIEKDAFIINWTDYAYNTLQWDDTQIGIYVFTWLLPSEIFGKGGNIFLQPAPNEGAGGGGNNLPCKCNYDWICGAWDCVKGNCQIVGGCGLFGWSDCKGDCRP